MASDFMKQMAEANQVGMTNGCSCCLFVLSIPFALLGVIILLAMLGLGK